MRDARLGRIEACGARPSQIVKREREAGEVRVRECSAVQCSIRCSASPKPVAFGLARKNLASAMHCRTSARGSTFAMLKMQLIGHFFLTGTLSPIPLTPKSTLLLRSREYTSTTEYPSYRSRF